MYNERLVCMFNLYICLSYCTRTVSPVSALLGNYLVTSIDALIINVTVYGNGSEKGGLLPCQQDRVAFGCNG